MTGAKLSDFVQDKPTTNLIQKPKAGFAEPLIAGVEVTSLSSGKDDRGQINELLTTRDGPIEPIVHVYQITAAAGSVRAWVFHRNSDDRLAFTQGQFRVVLYDLRPDSPSLGRLNVFDVGRENRIFLRIPAFVAHGVQNFGPAESSFVNMPTRAYIPADPDKWRLPHDHPGIPYTF